MLLEGTWSLCLQGLHASDVSNAHVRLSYYWHSAALRLPAVLSDCRCSVSLSHLIPSVLLEMLFILLGHAETRDGVAAWRHKSAVM